MFPLGFAWRVASHIQLRHMFIVSTAICPLYSLPNSIFLCSNDAIAHLLWLTIPIIIPSWPNLLVVSSLLNISWLQKSRLLNARATTTSIIAVVLAWTCTPNPLFSFSSWPYKINFNTIVIYTLALRFVRFSSWWGRSIVGRARSLNMAMSNNLRKRAIFKPCRVWFIETIFHNRFWTAGSLM
jgi:hypothetical protein